MTRSAPVLHRRLVVRFALILAVTLIGFDYLAERIHQLVFHAMDVPMTILVEGPVLDGLGDGSATGVMTSVGFVDGVEQMGPTPTPQEVIDFFEGIGTVDPRLIESLPSVVRGEDAVFLSPEEFEQQTRDMQRVATAISWGTTLLAALLLGLGLSRLVTGRLGRLGAAIEATEHDPEESAEPAALDPALLRGGDEVARVAQAYDDSRRRVHELLQTLARRDRNRREWVAQISHDLRTPLTALLAGLERAGSTGQPTEDRARAVAAARADADRLRELVDDLVALARLEADERFVPEPLLGAELAERVLAAVAHLAEERGIALELRVLTDSTGLCFDGQGRGMQRVLENLLRNALEHATERVSLELERIDGDRIRFAIRDDGPGFPPGPISLGIGLRIATRFVELHGGQLELGDAAPGGLVRFDLAAS